jgi:glutathione S-transferase
MILYSGPMSMFGAKAQIALAEKGLAPQIVLVPFGLRRRYEPKHPEVARINPKGQVPVLIDGDIEVSDSTQIFEYLETAYPAPPLWPQTVRERTLARRVEHLSDEFFFPKVVRLMSAALSAGDRAAVIGEIDAYRSGVECQLANQSYLVGSFSYADIAFFMAELFAVVLGAKPEPTTPRLNVWRRLMARRPAVRDVVVPMVGYMSERGMPCPDFIELPPGADRLGGPEDAVTDAHTAHLAHQPAEIAGDYQRKDRP